MYIISAPKKNIQTTDAKRDTSFSYNRRIENEYNSILNSVADEVEGILSYYDLNDPQTSIDIMETLNKYANDLYDWAGDVFTGLLYQLNEDDERTWKKHSKLMSQRVKYELEHAPIEPMMEQYLADNVGLIQSMPLRAAERVQELVLQSLKTGEYRAEGLAEQIINVGNITRNRAKLIARTEVARISTGFTKARSEVLDLPWYMWKTSHDARVRSSHKLMNKVLIKWNDPAAPEELDPLSKKSYGHYHPGEIFNCRCFPQPIIHIDDITFPAKIYRGGRIQYINKSDFMALNSGQMAA